MTKRLVGGWVLLLLGAFLLTAAMMLWLWAPSRAERTPLNTTNNTYLTGQADKFDPTTSKVSNVPVWVVNKTRTDSDKSDDQVIVFVQTTCVNIDQGPGAHQCLKGDDPRLISDMIDVFAADRHTGVAVNSRQYLPADAVRHEGLVNKFPFGTEKKNYQYWNSVLGKTVTATYDSTQDVGGVKTYKFTMTVPTTNTEVAQGVQGTYANSTESWVEPRTGAIIDQKQHEVRKLPDGTTLLDMNLGFTKDTVAKGVQDAKDNLKLLHLLEIWAPLAGLVAGLICLIAGVLLLLRRPRPGTD